MDILDLFKPNIEKMKKKKDTRGLIKTLKHKDWKFRKEAAMALEEIGKPAEELLIQALGEEDKHVQARAALILGNMGHRRAVEPLIQILGGADYSLRLEAARALEKVGKQAVEPLIQILKHENRDVRVRAIEILGNIRDEKAIEPLIRALDDGDILVERGASEALEKMGKTVVEPLIRTLKDGIKETRSSVAWALRKIDDERVIEPLVQALKDEDVYVRINAAWALGEKGDERALETLFEALGNENWKARRSAARVLGRINSEKVIEPLVQALNDMNIYVKMEAADSLSGLGWKPRNNEQKYLRARTYLKIIAWAQNRDDDLQRKAIGALVKVDRESLIKALEDRDSDVRARAAWYLWNMGGRAVDPLIRALGDISEDVRSYAAFSLGMIRDKRAIGPLRNALRDKDRRVQEQAEEALRRCGGI